MSVLKRDEVDDDCTNTKSTNCCSGYVIELDCVQQQTKMYLNVARSCGDVVTWEQWSLGKLKESTTEGYLKNS